MSEDGDAPGPVPPAAASTTVTVTHGQHGDYVERLDSYFIANDIHNAVKKQAILLNAVGPSIYRLMKTLCLPGKPTEHSFEEIVDKVKNHFNPK